MHILAGLIFWGCVGLFIVALLLSMVFDIRGSRRSSSAVAPQPPKISDNPSAEEWAKATEWMIHISTDVPSLQMGVEQIRLMWINEAANNFALRPYLPRLIGALRAKARTILSGDVLQHFLAETEVMQQALTQPTLETRPEPVQPVPDGADVLADVQEFISRFVAYPSEAALVAHTLWIAHAWFMDWWESTPRLAFLSTEPGSGKSRCLEVTEPLVPNPVHAVNVTPTYLFRKISDPDGLPTILFDEVDTVFNAKGGGNETLRGVLNAGYRRGATAGRCSTSGVEELPAYCAVALAGLGNLPDTIMTRAVVIRLRRRPADAKVEAWRPRTVAPIAERLRDSLSAWSQARRDALAWPDLPEGIADRNADVWEPLIAVADLAGGEWSKRAREAALYMLNVNDRQTVADAQTEAQKLLEETDTQAS